MLNSKAMTATAVMLAYLCTAVPSEARINLKCSGKVNFYSSKTVSYSEENYVIDVENRKIILQDKFTGGAVATYNMVADNQTYTGDRQNERRTNSGLLVQNYEKIEISREDGSINTTLISTTNFPNGPDVAEINFQGRCVSDRSAQKAAVRF